MRTESREERRLDVLRAVIRAFVRSGEPVGSRSIAGTSGCAVSPATLRSVMAELEELGLLSQPHQSAGRVPTEEGYRRYIELVLRERQASPEAARALAVDSGIESGGDLPDVLAAASRALSRLCHCVGLVLHPRLSLTRFRHAHFLRLDRSRVVVVVVGEGGVVTDKVVRVEEDHGQDELDRISRYIVDRFQGSTLADVQRTLERELGEDRAAYDQALGSWRRFALDCLERCVESEPVYVDGAADAAGSAEFKDVERMRQLLSAYQEKGRIVRLLRSCREREGMQIRIGSEVNPGGEDLASGLAFVAVPYGDAGAPLGSVGVLGPIRMEYEKVIAVVDGVARDLSRTLSSDFPAPH